MKAVKSVTDVRRQVESRLTSILPGITVTSCGRVWARCGELGSEPLWGGPKTGGKGGQEVHHNS